MGPILKIPKGLSQPRAEEKRESEEIVSTELGIGKAWFSHNFPSDSKPISKTK